MCEDAQPHNIYCADPPCGCLSFSSYTSIVEAMYSVRQGELVLSSYQASLTWATSWSSRWLRRSSRKFPLLFPMTSYISVTLSFLSLTVPPVNWLSSQSDFLYSATFFPVRLSFLVWMSSQSDFLPSLTFSVWLSSLTVWISQSEFFASLTFFSVWISQSDFTSLTFSVSHFPILAYSDFPLRLAFPMISKVSNSRSSHCCLYT